MNRKLNQASGWLSRVSSDLLQSDYSSCIFSGKHLLLVEPGDRFLWCKVKVLVALPDLSIRGVGEQYWGGRADQRDQSRAAPMHPTSLLCCCLAPSVPTAAVLGYGSSLTGSRSHLSVLPQQWRGNERGIFHAVLSTVFDCASVPLSNALCIPLPVMPNTVISVFFS